MALVLILGPGRLSVRVAVQLTKFTLCFCLSYLLSTVMHSTIILFSSCAHNLFIDSGYGSSNLLPGDHPHTSRPSIRTIHTITASSSSYEASTLLYISPHISCPQASFPLPPILRQVNRHRFCTSSRRHTAAIFTHGRSALRSTPID
jgi:hypothetical protein